MQDIKSPLVKKMLDTNQYSMQEIFNTPGKIYSFLNPCLISYGIRICGVNVNLEDCFVNLEWPKWFTLFRLEIRELLQRKCFYVENPQVCICDGFGR